MELLEELYTGATPALRLLVEEVIRLFRLNSFGLEENLGWGGYRLFPATFTGIIPRMDCCSSFGSV